MDNEKKKINKEVLEYQPDAVEIEERPVSGKARWVLYLILGSLVAVVVGAVIFSVDRIVVTEGKLITTSPTIVLQPLNTAVIRSIDARVGDVVDTDQVLATLDSTFAAADLGRLNRQYLTLGAQVRRIQAELQNKAFAALPEEGEEGRLQEHLFKQRKVIFYRTKNMSEDKIAALKSKLSLNHVQRQGKEKQLKLLRDVEGTTARLPQKGIEYRLKLLEAQKARSFTASEIENLKSEEQVTMNELKQARSEWRKFVEERSGELIEKEVQLLNELEKVRQEITKAKRLNDLVSLRAPQPGVVLSVMKRSIGSIIQQAEPFFTLVPLDSPLEVEVNVQARDIGRIRVGDHARIKLDAFPYQKHDTLPGTVRIISEDTFQYGNNKAAPAGPSTTQDASGTFYRARITLLSDQLRNVPDEFRLMPGMKVRAEIKIGKRRVISYFLYPVIRALDESLREP